MKQLNRMNLFPESSLPIKIVQFGEGNFLRAFVGYAIQKLNKELDFNAGIAVVQPRAGGTVQRLKDQDGLYTLFMEGLSKGRVIREKELIANIVKGVDPYADFSGFLELARADTLEIVVSNTTEAGIAFLGTDTLSMQPAVSFPGKLTQLLYERFKYFNGASDKGLTIIPCELINNNSDALKELVLAYIEQWELEKAFQSWILNACSFHNTLVDRIVPGYPKDQIEEYKEQLDYEDKLIVTAEPYFLWVIEGGEKLKEKLPFHKTDLDVKIVKDIQPYRTRKVRILNGAHTAMVPISILYGNRTVRESVDNPFTGSFIRSAVYQEIIPTLNMEKEALEQFADAVFDRFRNPFIRHRLSSIALNSISKFKVRVLPSILQYYSIYKALPGHLVFAFACLIRFYKGEWKGERLPLNDDAAVLSELAAIWESDKPAGIARQVLGKEAWWGRDLNRVPGLGEAITVALQCLDEQGIDGGFTNFNTILNTVTDAE